MKFTYLNLKRIKLSSIAAIAGLSVFALNACSVESKKSETPVPQAGENRPEPNVTVLPTAIPEVTATPVVVPGVTAAPTAIPEVTAAPTAIPEVTVAPSPLPVATPTVNPPPAPLPLPTRVPMPEFNFVKECETVTLSADIKVTIDALKLAVKELNCQKASEKLEKATFLDLSSKNISNLQPLLVLKNIQILDLSLNSELEDFRVVGEFRTLKGLSLNKTKITSLEFLDTLENLEALSAENSSLNNIDSISRMKSLKYLYLSSSKISNIDAISASNKLTVLKIENQKLTNVNALSSQKMLQRVSVKNNELTDLEPLTNSPFLVELDASFNNLVTLPVFKIGLTMQTLVLSHNQIVDVSPLIGAAQGSAGTSLRKLQTLGLSFNKLADVSVLKRLENVNYLDLKGNELLLSQKKCPVLFETYCEF